jgi:hypothetical protein
MQHTRVSFTHPPSARSRCTSAGGGPIRDALKSKIMAEASFNSPTEKHTIRVAHGLATTRANKQSKQSDNGVTSTSALSKRKLRSSNRKSAPNQSFNAIVNFREIVCQGLRR